MELQILSLNIANLIKVWYNQQKAKGRGACPLPSTPKYSAVYN